MRTLKLQDNNLEEIKEECLRWYGAVILGSMEESIRRELLEFCYSHYIRVYLSPDIPDILMQGTETMDLFDTASGAEGISDQLGNASSQKTDRPGDFRRTDAFAFPDSSGSDSVRQSSLRHCF